MRAVETNADTSVGQMAPRYDAGENEAWGGLIDSTLIEWGRDPTLLEDDGFTPPSAETLRRACEIASVLRSLRFPAPTRIVPTGDGGISFQAEDGDAFISIEIAADGTVEYFRFSGAKLVERYEVLIARSIK
jgi:hypothetical protein